MKALGPPSELIFLNPAPPAAELTRKIELKQHPADAARIEKLSRLKTRAAGVEIMNIFSRLYCEEWPPAVRFEYKSFDIRLCNRVQESMGEFDFRDQLGQIPERSLLLTGEKDFIKPNLLADYRSAFSEAIELRNAKHMPFLDRPEDFLRAVTPYFERT